MSTVCNICGNKALLPPEILSLVALGVTLFAMAWYSRREGLSCRLSMAVGLIGLIGAFWGGHIYFVMANEMHRLYGDPWLLVRFWGGPKAVYGAFLGAALVSTGVIALRRRPFLIYADAWAPAIALGYGIARIACFLNGDDFGLVSDLPWAVRFPVGSDVYVVHLERGWIGAMDSHSLATHPTQLYHALVGFSAVLLLGRYKPNWHGGRLAIGMAFYGATRFLIEFYRDEYEQGGSILDLAQWLSIGFLITTILLWRNAKTRGEQYVKTPMRYDHVGTQ